MSVVGGAVIVNGAEAVDSVPAVKANVRVPALPLMRRSVKVTTPATAASVAVPLRVPPPLAIAAVTTVVLEMTRLPAASCNSTTGCVVSGEPTTAPTGCVLSAS